MTKPKTSLHPLVRESVNSNKTARFIDFWGSACLVIFICAVLFYLNIQMSVKRRKINNLYLSIKLIFVLFFEAVLSQISLCPDVMA